VKSSANPSNNLDPETVLGFGAEWKAFDFESADEGELDALFADYFSIFPWELLSDAAVGFDMGAGSGRWAARVAPRVGQLHVIDASAEALAVARRKLRHWPNCIFHNRSVDAIPLDDDSMDFGYSLGVLHHVPDTQAGLDACVGKLKPGAPFLLYLYYALDNRGSLYRGVWRATDLLRQRLSRLPFKARYLLSQAIALTVYWPLARGSKLAEALGVNVSRLPLSQYRNRSFYVMRNDSLDRFGTKLERRFTRDEIETMMKRSGLQRIKFREAPPYWCAVGYRTPG
jgi:SAM-dependent methyltransferase